MSLYLKSLTRVGRFKLLAKLLSKKDKEVLHFIFNELERNNIEVISLQDAFFN